MRRLLVSMLFLAVGCGSTQVERALDRARESDKPVVVEFYTDWCGSCRRFEEHVLPDERVQAALGDVEFVAYDAEGEGRYEANRLGVRGYPVFFVLDADGDPVARLDGAPSVERFVHFLQWGPLGALDRAAIERRLERGSVRDVLTAARWHAAEGEADRAGTLYQEAATRLSGSRRRSVVAEATRVVGGPSKPEPSGAEPPSPASAEAADARAFVSAIDAAGRTAAERCRSVAGGADVVLVRVELRENGGPPASAFPIADVGDELGVCVADAVSDVSFPPAPASAKGRATVPVRLGD